LGTDGSDYKPFGKLNLSPYKIIGRYDAVVDAPRIKYPGIVENISQVQVDQTIQELRELAEASELIGDPRSHPWRDTARSYYSEGDLEDVEDICKHILGQLNDISAFSEILSEQLGLIPLESQSDLQKFLTVGEIVRRSPGVPSTVLESSWWNDVSSVDVVELTQLGRDLQKRVQAIDILFKPSVYDVEHTHDVDYILEKSKGLRTVFVMLDSQYRTIRKRWIEYRRSSSSSSAA
jgi:hypothetical protein